MVTVPTKFVFDKSSQESRALVGYAKKSMLILERLMEYQGLEQLQYRVVPYPGALVVCSKRFGIRTVEIYTGGEQPTPKKKVRKECLCFPHVTTGFIVKIYPEDIPPLDATLTAGRFYYDMLLCRGSQYVMAREVWASGWEQYFVGQMVMVSIGGPIDIEEYPDYPEYDCDRFCLLQEPAFTSMVVVPLTIPGMMKKWPIVREVYQ